MIVNFYASATTMYTVIFNETLKIWRKKTEIDKTYANFVKFMTLQEEDLLSNQPTSGAAGFRNSVVDDIVHEKMQELINQMVSFDQSPTKE